MDVVALTALATSPDVEAPHLATDLGVTAYEARQKLAVGFPCVVLMTTDRARATSVLRSLRERGHGAIACDGRAVVASGTMLPIRRFQFEADALVVDSGATENARLPYASMLAIVRATHRHAGQHHTETKETKFRPMAAIVSGGVILTKTVTRDVVRTTEEREGVLYLFARGRGPCILRESAGRYEGLGEDLRPTRLENFLSTVRVLRERAPSVPYDERLLTMKKFPVPPEDPGAPRLFDRETGGVDLLAHLLAMWLSQRP